jgi:predicted nucleic acid-binding protein
MQNSWVLNASPLIILNKVGLLQTLSPLAEKWIIPEAVVREISRRSKIKPLLSKLEDKSQAVVLSVNEIDLRIMQWNLGRGESEVITLALIEGAGVVLDDLQARKCAKLFDVNLIGTIGLVLKAKQVGLIDKVKPVFTQLIQSGLYIDPKLIEKILFIIKE